MARRVIAEENEFDLATPKPAEAHQPAPPSTDPSEEAKEKARLQEEQAKVPTGQEPPKDQNEAVRDFFTNPHVQVEVEQMPFGGVSVAEGMGKTPAIGEARDIGVILKFPSIQISPRRIATQVIKTGESVTGKSWGVRFEVSMSDISSALASVHALWQAPSPSPGANAQTDAANVTTITIAHYLKTQAKSQGLTLRPQPDHPVFELVDVDDSVYAKEYKQYQTNANKAIEAPSVELSSPEVSKERDIRKFILAIVNNEDSYVGKKEDPLPVKGYDEITEGKFYYDPMEISATISLSVEQAKQKYPDIEHILEANYKGTVPEGKYTMDGNNVTIESAMLTRKGIGEEIRYLPQHMKNLAEVTRGTNLEMGLGESLWGVLQAFTGKDIPLPYNPRSTRTANQVATDLRKWAEPRIIKLLKTVDEEYKPEIYKFFGIPYYEDWYQEQLKKQQKQLLLPGPELYLPGEGPSATLPGGEPTYPAPGGTMRKEADYGIPWAGPALEDLAKFMSSGEAAWASELAGKLSATLEYVTLPPLTGMPGEVMKLALDMTVEEAIETLSRGNDKVKDLLEKIAKVDPNLLHIVDSAMSEAYTCDYCKHSRPASDFVEEELKKVERERELDNYIRPRCKTCRNIPG